jgi:transcriptional regulator with XRE-family HTH domain
MRWTMDKLETTVAAALGKAIREHRSRIKLSQAGLAESIDASVEFVSLIERGARLPSIGTLVRVAQVLGVTAGALLDANAVEAEDDPALLLLRRLPRGSRAAAMGMLKGLLGESRRKKSRKRG